MAQIKKLVKGALVGFGTAFAAYCVLGGITFATTHTVMVGGTVGMMLSIAGAVAGAVWAWKKSGTQAQTATA